MLKIIQNEMKKLKIKQTHRSAYKIQWELQGDRSFLLENLKVYVKENEAEDDSKF